MSLPIYQRVAVTDAGDVIPGAEYTVINENTGVAAPIYSDRTGATLLTAPYFADSVGTIQFFIAQGTTFRVAASGGVGTYTDRYVYGVAEAVLVQADGNVGIGTVSADTNLHIRTATAGSITSGADRQGSVIRLEHDANYEAGYSGGDFLGGLEFYSGDSSGGQGVRTAIKTTIDDPYNANSMVFYTASGNEQPIIERARIDYSGNLLVGTTQTDVGYTDSGSGVSLDSTGYIQAARSSVFAVMYLNKLDNDGDILQFRKDGITVGSWQSRASLVSTIILDPRASGVGLSGGGPFIYPTNNAGAISDGAIGIGRSTSRFSDLFLSGGVYLGGTAAANKLDDYEEGTWTPTYVGSGVAGSSPTGVGTYTKVGRMVTVTANFGNFTASGATGNLHIDGLPFTPSSASGNLHTGAVASSNLGADVLASSILVNEGFIRLRAANTSIFKTVINASSIYLYTTVTYETA